MIRNFSLMITIITHYSDWLLQPISFSPEPVEVELPIYCKLSVKLRSISSDGNFLASCSRLEMRINGLKSSIEEAALKMSINYCYQDVEENQS